MTVECKLIDYTNPTEAKHLTQLLNEYAQDPMGGGKPLSDEVVDNLAVSLSKRNDAYTVIAYIDEKPAGLANCFESFSTFKCQPLMNIHDIIVSSQFRGQGICKQLLVEVEKLAQQKNCCKLTLEVLEGNTIAQKAYLKFGFAGYELDPEMGKALFWEKSLN
ncbi:GNAT family N-acetyltransferase [Aliikangiella coralliicola]|uniref:GNAT family N-acetyltransferase n=1 Tax=Aliikangiella coralliicola TaxID=2592383 RepID=A0A545U691_9GAMM|nr:GNAT family N-acetyltransferase [Aliikangiella coralliicola]TQV84923.1 GNAT family N-acetyltransferase [Aliikangiella coralliicola]